ncbi:MAG: methyltransferase domain-containing protein [Ferruginibacter sp.]|nr:methyltransferase domain-containing protein [Ferruginibacter sp.]
MSTYTHLELTHNKKSASTILPIIINLFNPKSVIDVGCGTGSFLSVLSDLGLKDIKGVEGDWLDRSKLYVDSSLIDTVDLQKLFSFDRKFDLAICLEVAEHLAESTADDFVHSLTKLSGVILFSAAIPGQGGQNHLNEKWVDYWQNKFKRQGYSFYDIMRLKFWNNDDVEFWYKQNMFIIIDDKVDNFGLAKVESINTFIHPELFTLIVNNRNDLYEKYINLAWGKEKVGMYFKLFCKSILKKMGLTK